MGSLIDGTPTRLDGGFVHLPNKTLIAIVLGCENKDQDEIGELVNTYAPEIVLRRAVRVPNHFRLTIADLPASTPVANSKRR